MLNKIFNLETKSVNEKERIVEHFITMEVVDRDNEIIRVDGIDLENYKKNPVVLWAHGYDFNRGMVPIGKNLKLSKVDTEDQKGIYALTQFYDDAFSENIFKMYKDGFLKTWSIGFISKQDRITDDDGHGIFPMTELLEYSSVPIPANPEAKMKGYISEKENKFWELAQKFHWGEKEFLNECYRELLREYKKLEDEANNMRIALPDMTNQRNALLDKLRQTIGKELPAQDYELGKLFIPILMKIFKFGDLAEKNDDMIGEENLNETKWFLRRS